MTPKYVTRIESNVKTGVCAELTRLTLVVGPNGSGKTALVNSLELALGGFATDVMGKDALRKPGDLMVLSKDGQTLTVSAQLSDGKSASFGTVKTRTGARRPKRTGPGDVVFPFADVIYNLTGSVAKARVWFLQRISRHLTLESVIQCFPLSLRDDYQDKATRLQKVEQSWSQVDILIHLAEQEAKRGRESRATLKIVEQTLEEMNVPPWPPNAEEIATLKTEENQALDTYTSAMRNNAGPTKVELQQAWEKASFAIQQVERAEKVQADAQLQLDLQACGEHPLTAKDKYWADVRRELLVCLDLHKEIKASECLVCGGQVDELEQRHKLFTEANAQFDALYAVEHDLTTAIGEVARAKEAAQQAVALYQALQAQSNDFNPDTLLALRQQYQELLNKRVELEGQMKQWETITHMKDRIEEEREKEKKAKKMAKECQNAIKTLLQASIQDFETSVQAYLPTSDSFSLEVDTKSDNCRFGLQNGEGPLRCAMSGAEWARVITAIGCATIDNGQFALFLPEERAFDPHTLSGVMGALENAPGQVVLTSTVHPDEANENWTIIDLSPQG